MATKVKPISENVNLNFPDIIQVQGAPDEEVVEIVKKFFSTQTFMCSYSYHACSVALSRVHYRHICGLPSDNVSQKIIYYFASTMAHLICYLYPYKLNRLQEIQYQPEVYENIKRISCSSVGQLDEMVRLFPHVEEVVIHASAGDSALETLKQCKKIKRLQLDYCKFATEKKVRELMENSPIKTLVMKKHTCLTIEYLATLKEQGVTVVETLPGSFHRDAKGVIYEEIDTDADID